MHDWNLGSTGARGWVWAEDYDTRDSRQILITSVRKNTPASGILNINDVILGVGDTYFSRDARKALGFAITKAEEKNNQGNLKLIRWRKGKEERVTIKIPVMGSYSETAPYQCEKSKKLFFKACEYLKQNGFGEGIQANVNALAALASGQPEFASMLKLHASRVGPKNLKLDIVKPRMVSWDWSYSNLFLCEYYLATGDVSVLSAIREYSENIAKGQNVAGTWGHGMAFTSLNHGKLHGRLGGYGSLNQVGIVCAMSLALAKKCKIDSPEISRAIDRANNFLAHYIDKGTIPYGDMLPYEVAHDNNGVNSSAALFFDFVGYERGVQYFSRMSVASYGIPEVGHTGNYFSLLWAPLGANRSGMEAGAVFLKELRWYFDMERHTDGSYLYEGQPGTNDDSYLEMDCTGARLLMLSMPLKKIYITGRELNPKISLKGKSLAETIDAGKGVSWSKRLTLYDEKSTTELIQLLSNWSPIVRNRASWSLKNRKDVPISSLVKMLESNDTQTILGGLRALRLQGIKAAPAVSQIMELLDHNNDIIRIHSLYALTAIGQPARKAIPKLLSLSQEINTNDPNGLFQRNLCLALFDSGDLKNPVGLLVQSLEDVNRKDVIKVIKKMIRIDEAYARGCITQMYKHLSIKEISQILPDIVWGVENPPARGLMWGETFPLESLKILSKYRVKEGLPVLMKYIKEQQQWDSQGRTKKLMKLFRPYGIYAKEYLPELRSFADWCRTEEGFPEWARKVKRRNVEAGMQKIESSEMKPKLISAKVQ